MLQPADLIRVAELIRLGAETARAFGHVTPNGMASRIGDAADRIDAAADELERLGREMADRPPDGSTGLA